MEGTEVLGHAPLQNPKGWGCRHTITLLGFLAYNLLHGMRVSMSIAIVAMVKHPNDSLVLPQMEVNTSTAGLKHREDLMSQEPVLFDWNEKSQGVILGAIYWGSLFVKIPGGLIAHRFGGKWPLGLAMLGIAMTTMLIPLAATLDWRCLIVVRSVQGGQLGTALVMILSGYLIEANLFGGWPAPFYITGSLTLLWVCFWLALASDSPNDCKRITVKEMLYIQRTIGTGLSVKRKSHVPWRDMLGSLPVWAIIVANTSDAWGFYTFLTELPTYMRTVLKFNLKANSTLSAMPYLISWGFAVTLTQIGDHLISTHKVPIVFVRKACQTIGHLGSAVVLILATYVGHNPILVVTLVTIGIAINGATHGGYGVNHVDIAPNHAGVLLAVTSTIASLCAIGAPYVAGSIINNDPTPEKWQIVFFISAGLYLFDAVFYNLFASGEEQPWDNSSSSDS